MDRLIDRIIATNNPVAVGLDPNLDFIPHFIKQTYLDAYEDPLEGAAACLIAYNRQLIDAVYDIVPAVKPQAAYYEMYGWQGVRALYETIVYARSKGLYVLTDGKRNDIGSTMEAYARAHLGKTPLGEHLVEPFGADALTVNGYLGTDGIAPLQAVCRELDKDIFVLVKTSNPSAGELQDRLIEGKPLYEQMGNLCERWGEGTVGKYGYSSVGAVVGATYREHLQALRNKLPHTFFLVPGYGAQGATAQDVQGAFDQHGFGALINSSRGVLCAYQKEKGTDEREFADAARREVIRMRDEICHVIPPLQGYPTFDQR